MNYFSYFTEIEDTFIRRRGKHLLLSPIDWALIEIWKERGVPLHVVLRGIEQAFDSHEKRKRRRSVKTLLYCQEEVEAQYAEWLEARVGGHQEARDAQKENGGEGSPFPRSVVLAHLARLREALSGLAEARQQDNADDLGEALGRGAALLNELEQDYSTAAQPEPRKLEDSLTGVERLLDQAISSTVSATELQSERAAIESRLQPYKRHMDTAAFRQTCENLLRTRLRESLGVPRLSLFFMK